VSLVGKGPELKIRVEIKPGQITTYTLSIDDSAKFLVEHAGESFLGQEVKKLQVANQVAKPTSRIYASGDVGDINVDRMVAIDLTVEATTAKTKSPKPLLKAPFSPPTNVAYKARTATNFEKRWSQFAPFKQVARYIGQSYIFVEEFGYIPYDRTAVTDQWQELTYSKKLEDDDAAIACSNGFSDHSDLGTIHVDPDLLEDSVVQSPTVSRVKILAGDEHWFNVSPLFETGDG
jgi:hypothetical protein